MIRYLLAFAMPMVRRTTRRVVLEVENQVHKILIAVSVTAAGIACVIVGLTYLASAFWHALAPAIGPVGADLILGGSYGLIAALLLAYGFRLVR